MATHEIVEHGKPFTDGEYVKESFIKISEHIFTDFKNKSEIVQKIRDMPLSAKTVNSTVAYLTVCDKSKDKGEIRPDAGEGDL